ncbi:uncharacterized protein LOC125656579 [Ostrea edulis]|uniref:uncharacterized protein LOC125656579 n=1 Tax=Ostrea edulis TaxID=37623 RepID=UPI0024AED6BC|nr:uncharacterized protein LOC125656579 [Ostrea edulis]
MPHGRCDEDGVLKCEDMWYGSNCSTHCIESQHVKCDEEGRVYCSDQWYGKNCSFYCKGSRLDKCSKDGSGAVTIDGQLNEKSVSELEFSIKFFLSENLCKKGTNIHVGIDVLNGVDKSQLSTVALSIACGDELINSDTFLQTYWAMAPEKLKKYHFPCTFVPPPKRKHNVDWLSKNWRMLAVLFGATAIILFIGYFIQKYRRKRFRRIEKHVYTVELQTTEIYK